MFEDGFIRNLAKAVASEVAQQQLVAPRLLSLDQAAIYLGMTKAALKLGKAAGGEVIPPDRVKIKGLLRLVENDYELKERASLYIAKLKINRYLLPISGS